MNGQNFLPWIDLSTCAGCGDCISICPTGALGLRDQKAAVVNPDACTYSSACEAACPVAAIALPYEIILESDLDYGSIAV